MYGTLFAVDYSLGFPLLINGKYIPIKYKNKLYLSFFHMKQPLKQHILTIMKQVSRTGHFGTRIGLFYSMWLHYVYNLIECECLGVDITSFFIDKRLL